MSVSKMKLVVFLFAVVQAALLAGQITTLVSTYWTSWDLRFNWTRTSGELNRRPPADGQMISQGHAGLWSRCIKVYSTDKDGNHPKIRTDQCFQNYQSGNTSIPYTFGKACKTATAALCVAEAAVTVLVLVVTLVLACWNRGRRILRNAPLSLVLLQGAILFIIPLAYISGNMAELIDQLSAAHGLLLVVGMRSDYAHDWAYWLQVGLFGIWLISSGLYTILYYRVQRSVHRSKSSTNGKKAAESAEMEPLRSEK